MNPALLAAGEQWGALLLTIFVILAALGAVTARSLFAMALYLAAAFAMAGAALLALMKPDAALALTLFGVAILPFLMLSSLLLSARVIKPGRKRSYLALAGALGVALIILVTIPDMGVLPPHLAMGPEAAPRLPIAPLAAPLLFVGAAACLGLLGFGERGVFGRSERPR
jgi:hypothetical protein